MDGRFETRLQHLGFRRFRPAELLAEYIDCYWFIDCNNRDVLGDEEFLHPNGGMGIILNYGDPLYFEQEIKSDACILDGTSTISRRLGLSGHVSAVGIRFRPTGASPFFPSPLHELKNRNVRLSDTDFRGASDLYHKLSGLDSDREKATAIDRHLFECILEKKNISTVVMESVTLIRAHQGSIGIGKVATSLGYDQRRIERLFNAQVGMTQKEYARALKIQVARKHIRQFTDRSFTDIALDLGYFDQAHFNKQFKSVVGITPRDYRFFKQTF